MFEVEIKLPADVESVRDRLRDAGAERRDARLQRDSYYDAPHRDFAETDEALRVRHETPLSDGTGSGERNGGANGERSWGANGERNGGANGERSGAPDAEQTPAGTTKITYKGPRIDADSKTRVEHETEVSDADATVGLFSGLGFEPAATVEKRREFWSLAGFTVALDRVDGLGEFVEIEREVAAEGDIEATRDEALGVLERLGLDGDTQVRTSYLGQLLAQES